MVKRERVVVAAAVAALAAAPAAHATRIAFLRGGNLVVRDLATQAERVVLRHAGAGPVAWSGDGRLVSSGGRIAGGPSLPAARLVWAPRGERAAYVTRRGGAVVWTRRASRRVVPDGWGATMLAWSPSGKLALGRSVCHVPCGIPAHREVWVWNGRALRRVVSVPTAGGAPMPVAWAAGSRVVLWLWPGSGSVAADGVSLYLGGRRIGETLMYPEYVVRCGAGLVFAAGRDRYATRGKRIVLDGRDVSRDRSRSWVSPSCSPDGRTLAAAAGRNWEEDRFGREHRAIWQLLPGRRQLTHPPAGWTDENPAVLPDGSILFVRTQQTAARWRNGQWRVTIRGELERLAGRRLSPVANVGYSAPEADPLGGTNYYGRYGWASRIAVAP